MKHKLSKGLIQIYTGSGKGKTTAAIGLANRATANNLKVIFIQFLKSHYDKKSITQNPQIDYYHFGLDHQKYGWLTKDENGKVSSGYIEKFQKIIQKAWRFTKSTIKTGQYDLVILDEINLAVYFEFINIKDIIETIQNRPVHTEIIITGQKADPKLKKIADLITEMKEIKHPFQKGLLARKGIDY